MTRARLASAALLLIALACPSTAAPAEADRQPPVVSRPFALGRAATSVVVINPTAATLEISVRLRAGGHDTRALHVFVRPTSERHLDIGGELEAPNGGDAPVTAVVECLNEASGDPCRADDRLIVAVVTDGPDRLLSAAGWPRPLPPWPIAEWIGPRFSRLGRLLTPVAAASHDLVPQASPERPGFEPIPAAPAPEWYFAEGYNGLSPTGMQFVTDFVIRNADVSRDADLTISFFRASGPPIDRRVRVAAGEQAVVRSREESDLSAASFSTRVRSDNGVPVVAHRVMQWGRQPAAVGEWSAANCIVQLVDPGQPRTARTWVFPATRTGHESDSYLLVFNPSVTPLRLRVTFMGEDGSGTVVRVPTIVGPGSRFTVSTDMVRSIVWNRRVAIFLESMPAGAADERVPFLAERSVYAGPYGWTRGQVTAGVAWDGPIAVPSSVSQPLPASSAIVRRLMAPYANVATWLCAGWVFWRAARRSRRAGTGGAAPTAQGTSIQSTLLLALALLAIFLPTSVGGHTSRGAVASGIIGSAALLGALALQPGGRARGLAEVNAALLMAVLSVATVFTPLPAYAPGTVFIYLGLALLFVLDLRGVPFTRRIEGAFVAINLALIALAIGVMAGFGPVTGLLATFYSHFRPELIGEMIAARKPVGPFTTHSLAAFMFYLLACAALLRFQSAGRVAWLGLALAHAALLAGLRSTSANILLFVLALQVGWSVWHHDRRWRPFLAIGTAVALAGAGAWAAFDHGRAFDAAQGVFVGDRVHGFLARFGNGGLMEANMRFLGLHPLTPVGFGLSDRLYFGDSGVVVNLLRGGVPALLLVYGGLFAFFRRNVASRRVALWLWAVTTLFEIGFTPLQLYRFVAFAPFYVVCINAFTRPPRP
jgi:hypothetical protein